MRAELIKRAEAMLKSRHIESPFDVSHDELPSLLADFAAAEVKAERERIADELAQLFRNPPPAFRVMGRDLPPSISSTDWLIKQIREYIDQLRTNK